MFRRIVSYLFILLLLASCEYFSPTTTTSNNHLQVLDTIVDYTKIDIYPIFYDCEDFSEDDNQKGCFEASLSKRLSEILHKNNLKVKEVVNDTTHINLFIDKDGKQRNTEPRYDPPLPVSVIKEDTTTIKTDLYSSKETSSKR